MLIKMNHVSDAPKFTLQKLNMTNYYLWSNKTEVILRRRGLWRYIDIAQRAKGTQEEGHVKTQKKDQVISLLLM